jgi:ApaG protein
MDPACPYSKRYAVWPCYTQEPMEAAARYGSVCVTRHVRVEVSPRYLGDHSNPTQGRWVFAYHIRITNEGQEIVQLRRRHWIIVDGDGDRHDVVGEGVVGHQPMLLPGACWEYTSYCPLETFWGTMEGTYTFVNARGEEFPVKIARFYLVGPATDAPRGRACASL